MLPRSVAALLWASMLALPGLATNAITAESVQGGANIGVWAYFTTEDSDLPSNIVRSLLEGPDGSMWVGTALGLARLKGGQWEVYGSPDSELAADVVDSLVLGTDGTLWVGTQTNGLARFKDGEWRVYRAADSGLPDDHVHELALGRDGALWVGTWGGGLARFKDDQWRVYRAADSGLPHDRVDSLAVSPDGALWVATTGMGTLAQGAGLAQLKDGQWRRHEVADFERIPALVLDHAGGLWVGTGDNGLAQLKDGRWHVYQAANSGLPGDAIASLAIASDGSLWVGTVGDGLARFKDDQWRVYRTADSGLPHDRVDALAVSSGGVLWVGTRGSGLARLKDGPWHIYRTDDSGLPDDDVSAVALGLDGALWVGTNGGGLAQVKDRQWEVYRADNSGLPYDDITVLALGPDGALWVGGFDGLARLKEGQWQNYKDALGSQIRAVSALAVGPQEALWVATWGLGLARLKDGQWQNSQSGLEWRPSNHLTALARGPEGSLWVGTSSQGLARFREGGGEAYRAVDSGLPNDSVSALALGPDGALWVGTNGGGLARLKDGQWNVFQAAVLGLPDDHVSALTFAPNGALWVGTQDGGLARLKDGQWNVFRANNTGLPNNRIAALAIGPDGALWVGTRGGGLARLRLVDGRALPRVNIVGAADSLAQSSYTFGALAFDPNYETSSIEFRYEWTKEQRRATGGNKVTTWTTRTPFRTFNFEDGSYEIRVRAIDRVGFRSEPASTRFEVKLAMPQPVQFRYLKTVFVASGLLYLLALFPLVYLYSKAGWARTAVNSGLFTRFPLVHKTILNTRWARRRLFRKHASACIRTAEIPDHYIPQSVLLSDDDASAPIVSRTGEFLLQLNLKSRRALVLGRSGTGKSVLLNTLLKVTAEQFLDGSNERLPIALDLRTRPLAGRSFEALIRDELAGSGVELPSTAMDFLIRKGKFLLLIDSLNEVAELELRESLNPFLNRDSSNQVLLASQLDVLKRPEIAIYRLAQVSEDQARTYLGEVTGSDPWSQLSAASRRMSSNPQDLALLGEILQNLAADQLPVDRADLYRELLNSDQPLATWVQADRAEIHAIYGVAFRMIDENKRVVPPDELGQWIRHELEGRDIKEPDAVETVLSMLQRSRMFRHEKERGPLGSQRTVVGFQHELMGKFLASRFLRDCLDSPPEAETPDLVKLSSQERWLDVFFFLVDELDSSIRLNRFLSNLVDIAKHRHLVLIAYAHRTKSPESLDQTIIERYHEARLAEDLVETPAAA